MRLLNRTGREKLAGKLCQKKSLPLPRTKEAPRLLEPLDAQRYFNHKRLSRLLKICNCRSAALGMERAFIGVHSTPNSHTTHESPSNIWGTQVASTPATWSTFNLKSSNLQEINYDSRTFCQQWMQGSCMWKKLSLHVWKPQNVPWKS